MFFQFEQKIMDEKLAETSAEMVKIVSVILDPSSDSSSRACAHQMLERFRDTSTLCAKCGFFITYHYEDPSVRHFGLQLIDYYIRLHWNSIKLSEKVWIKNEIMETISKGTNTTTKEQQYIKDAISRIVVEIIKREWPQQWPTLLDELDDLSKLGNKETEIVLLIFLRLIEDVVLIQNLPDRRRRDIRKILNSNIDRIFLFLWHNVTLSYDIYLAQKGSDPMSELAVTKCRLADLALETIAVFVEMVPIANFLQLIGFNKLCILLEDNCFRNKVAFCLLNIIEIQTSAESKQKLYVLFEEDSLFRVARNFLSCNIDINDEQQCYFLKLLSRIFLSLSQVLSYSAIRGSTNEPKNFLPFLECIVLFIQHPSIASLQGQHMLLNILRTPVLTSSDTFIRLIPSLLKWKVGKLIELESISNDSSIWKHTFGVDDEEEFRQISINFRIAVQDNLKEITKLQLNAVFSYAEILIQSLLREGNWMSLMEFSNYGRSTVICWKVLVSYLEPISAILVYHMHRGNTSIVKELSPIGLMLLTQILNTEFEDPDSLSYALSCLSNLFIFVTFSDSDHCVKALDKIFMSLSYEGNDLYGGIHLKRHASALLIKLSSYFPQILFLHFDYIYQHICEFSQKLADFSQFDRKSALIESILILSNEFCDFERQSRFIQEVLSSIEQLWMSELVQIGISTPEHFISLLGIDVPYNASDEGQSLSTGAKAIKLCLSVFNAVARRCIYPKDPEIATKGNFINPQSQSFSTVYFKNPAAPYLLSKIPGMFQIIKVFNSLYEPSNRSKVHPSYSSVVDADNLDKFVIPNVTNKTILQQKSRLQRMEMFFPDTYQICLGTLGYCAEFLNIDFYLIPSLPNHLRDYIFYDLQHVSDKRIRVLIRCFLQQFFICCPPTTDCELLLILSAFLKFMRQKLNSIWEKFKLKYGNSLNYEENQTEIEDIAEDVANRMLSRAYIDFLHNLLLRNSSKSNDGDDVMIDDSKPAKQSKNTLSEFGKILMQTEDTRAAIICTAFDSLHWPDCALNFKSLAVCEALFKYLTENSLIRLIHEAKYLLHSVLHSIHELGQHETNFNFLIVFAANVYEYLKLTFPEMSQILLESIDCDPSHLKDLDDILLRNPIKNSKRDKMMKDAFKRAIEKIIGVSIGQQHTNNIIIKNLSPLIRFSRKENTSIFDLTNDEIGLCNLFVSQDKEN